MESINPIKICHDSVDCISTLSGSDILDSPSW